MGQYKVPQDVEAEDKILGPLTFKEFIYFLMGLGWAIVCFALFRSVPALLAIIGFPPCLLLFLLAFYNRDGQKFEQILISMAQFFAAERIRYWVKSDVIETFHIAPTVRPVEQTQRNATEVRSELEKLANLVDSRGWGKEPDPETVDHTHQLATPHSDRLVAPSEIADTSAQALIDILDMKQSPLAQNLAQLLQQAADEVRQEAVNQMAGKPVATPAPNAPAPISTSVVTPAPAGDIIQLATQSDDLTVSQLAAQATRRVVQLPNGQTVEVPNDAR